LRDARLFRLPVVAGLPAGGDEDRQPARFHRKVGYREVTGGHTMAVCDQPRCEEGVAVGVVCDELHARFAKQVTINLALKSRGEG